MKCSNVSEPYFSIRDWQCTGRIGSAQAMLSRSIKTESPPRLVDAISYPCGRADHALLAGEIRLLPSVTCVRRHPGSFSLQGRPLPIHCMRGSGWQSRVYRASVRTPLSRQHRLELEMSSIYYDTTHMQLSRGMGASVLLFFMSVQ